ncbi:MAG: acetyl-CoA carboxylase biotin carboxylase subunit [Desulfocucumaceae bacterium]
MFNSILVANRGEIALRIIRACREMNISTVAVFSEADRDSLPVRAADRAVCIGPDPPAGSYLNMRNIVSAAIVSGADAIHPGYGFLAENPGFAGLVEEKGIAFIGPPARAIEKMGDKAAARDAVAAGGVPVVPGSPGLVKDPEEALKIAEQIGYPVIIKASAGGGGRGMRVARDSGDLARSFYTARTESAAAFGNDGLYIEKFIENPRHIEFQILADKYGNTIHLGERDCSIQRRNQKMIEEAPSTALTESLRKEMGRAAVMAARSVGYHSAGTVEFLLDPGGKFYFIEMNTRIQVEHPVTEMITGVDLVKEQIRIASGEKMGLSQEDVIIRGWSVECRLNAEDPGRNFAPCPGRIKKYIPPGGPGVRVDSAAFQGWNIPRHYDSMLGKLITWGRDREEAISRMARALDEFIIEGVKTTIPFHREVMKNDFFLRGELDTGFIGKHMKCGN